MITLNANIKLQASLIELLSEKTSFYYNNISGELPLNEQKVCENPFIIGVSKLGDGSTFCDKVDYYIGKSSNSSGTFDNDYKFEIEIKTDESYVIIDFDTVNNRHPNTLIVKAKKVNDNVITCNNSSIVIPLSGSSDNTYTIVIDTWNTPNYPIVISGIYTNVELTFDKTNISDCDFSRTFKGTDYIASYGLISNNGSITIQDRNGIVLDLLTNNALKEKSNAKIIISLKNSLAKNKYCKIATFYINHINYNKLNNECTISFYDKLSILQSSSFSLYVNPFNFYETIKNGKVSEIYDYIVENYNEILLNNYGFEMVKFSNLDKKTQDIMSNIIISIPFLKEDTFWNNLSKISQVCGLYFYMDVDNNLTCCYTMWR